MARSCLSGMKGRCRSSSCRSSPRSEGPCPTLSSWSHLGKADAQRRHALVTERPRPRTTAPFANREVECIRHSSMTIAMTANRRARRRRVLSDRQHALQLASARTGLYVLTLFTSAPVSDQDPWTSSTRIISSPSRHRPTRQWPWDLSPSYGSGCLAEADCYHRRTRRSRGHWYSQPCHRD